MLVVTLAIVEVAVFETLIRLNVVGVERAAGSLFIFIALNVALVAWLRRLRR
jgi:hypothetical protein